MMYKRTQKIPTVFAFLIILAGLGGAIYLDRFTHTYESSAKSQTKAENVRFTNITDNSFSVSWMTDISAEGLVELTPSAQKKIILDDLDNDNISRKRITHHITVRNLKESTEYTVRLLSGVQCSLDELCPTLRQKTVSKQELNLNLPLSRGVIKTAEGKQASEAIVYLAVGQGQPLSTRTDSSGLWAISLNLLKSQSPLTKLEFSDNDLVQVTASTSLKDKTTSIIDFKTLRQNVPVPEMQIGNSYNFIDLLSKKNQLAGSNSQKVLGTDTSLPPPGSTFDILFPLHDYDVTPESKPRLRGIGPKGREILITVNSSPQTGKVTVENDGTWNWKPPNDLPPGNHTITIGLIENGKLLTRTKKLIVLKSGERVLGEATSSAALSPTASISPTVTITRTATLTPSPTEMIATPTYIPSPTPKPTIPVTFTPQPVITVTPPRTGNIKLTLLLAGSGLALFAMGTKLLLGL